VSRCGTLVDLGEGLKYGCSLTCLWYPCNCTTGLTHVELSSTCVSAPFCS